MDPPTALLAGFAVVVLCVGMVGIAVSVREREGGDDGSVGGRGGPWGHRGGSAAQDFGGRVMPDWLRRTIRTAVQVGLGNLAWAVVKLAVFRTVTPELDFAVNALCTGIGVVLVSAAQNSIENTWPNVAVFKPEAQVLNANDGRIPGEGSK